MGYGNTQQGLGPQWRIARSLSMALLDSGWNHDALRSCVDLPIKTFYAPDDGAFHTLFQGRSKYWLGPSVEANAFAAYFMERLAPSSYSTIKKSALKYILSYPLAPTGWKERWFQQQAVSNSCVLCTLAAVGESPRSDLNSHSSATELVCGWLLEQERDFHLPKCPAYRLLD